LTVLHAYQIARGETYLPSKPSTITLRYEYLYQLYQRIKIQAVEGRNRRGQGSSNRSIKRTRSPEQETLREPDHKQACRRHHERDAQSPEPDTLGEPDLKKARQFHQLNAQNPEPDTLEELDLKQARRHHQLNAQSPELDTLEELDLKQIRQEHHQLISWKKPLKGAASRDRWDSQRQLLLSVKKTIPQVKKGLSDKTVSINKERADEILNIIRCVGNEEVLGTSEKMVLAEEERKALRGPVQPPMDHDTASRNIYQLMQLTIGRGFGEKSIKRFAQYWFSRDIDLRAEKLKRESPPSRQSVAQRRQRTSEESGASVARALNEDLDVVKPQLTKAEKDKERKHLRYWRIEGRIYVQLVQSFGSTSILLLLPYKSSPLFEKSVISSR
jgi:hypothetical protein